MTGAVALDVLAPLAGEAYEDARVIVRPGTRLHACAAAGGRVLIEHPLAGGVVDDDLAESLASLLAPLTDEHDVFARAFTGVVLTSGGTPADAWERFYRHNLTRVADESRGGYAPVYRHACSLLAGFGSVLDLGCGFGFLALHLAGRGTAVTAVDSDPGALRLLRLMRERFARPLEVVQSGDRVPVPSRSVDAVVLLHVLEHVDATTAAGLIDEALRISRRRVVVAVPYEDEPNPLYGHLRTFTPADLRRLGALTDRQFDVHAHHGGWLVLDQHESSRIDDPHTRGATS